MGLFSSKAKTDDNSARETLRRHLYAISRKLNLGTTAGNVEVPLPVLEDFANGHAELDAQQLGRLAKHLCDASYDPVTDRMHPLNPIEVRPVSTLTAEDLRFDVNDPRNKAVMPRPETINFRGGPGPTHDPPLKTKPSGAMPRRPGFAS
jgi:hypothetical protein